LALPDCNISHFSRIRLFVALVTITLFTPCIASVMVIDESARLERGIHSLGRDVVVAFLVGGILSQILI